MNKTHSKIQYWGKTDFFPIFGQFLCLEPSTHAPGNPRSRTGLGETSSFLLEVSSKCIPKNGVSDWKNAPPTPNNGHLGFLIYLICWVSPYHISMS